MSGRPPWLRPPRGDVVLALVFSGLALLPLPLWAVLPHLPTDPAAIDAPAGHMTSLAPIAPPTFREFLPQVLLQLTMTAPLAWRRRLPLVAFATQLGGVAAVWGDVQAAAFVGTMIGVYSVSTYHRSRLLSLAVVLGAAAGVALLFGAAVPDMPGWLTGFLLVVPVWLMGGQVRQWRAHAAASTTRAERLEQEREAATRAAIERERSRIARELHDVVAHNVSVMVIQATAARQVAGIDAELARSAMGAVEQVGQQAMAELRHLLDVLGAAEDAETDGSGQPPRPQPGLEQLGALLARVRAAGVRVSAARTGAPRPLSAGLNLAAYRIVQEALTNVLRHAPEAAAAVRLDYGSAGLVVEVTNGPAAGRPVNGADPAPGGGRGLVGLAERVHLVHGELEAGRRVDGGYRVCARIPWEPVQ